MVNTDGSSLYVVPAVAERSVPPVAQRLIVLPPVSQRSPLGDSSTDSTRAASPTARETTTGSRTTAGRTPPSPDLRDTVSGNNNRYTLFVRRKPPRPPCDNPIRRSINPASSNAANARYTDRVDNSVNAANVSTFGNASSSSSAKFANAINTNFRCGSPTSACNAQFTAQIDISTPQTRQRITRRIILWHHRRVHWQVDLWHPWIAPEDRNDGRPGDSPSARRQPDRPGNLLARAPLPNAACRSPRHDGCNLLRRQPCVLAVIMCISHAHVHSVG